MLVRKASSASANANMGWVCHPQLYVPFFTHSRDLNFPLFSDFRFPVPHPFKQTCEVRSVWMLALLRLLHLCTSTILVGSTKSAHICPNNWHESVLRNCLKSSRSRQEQETWNVEKEGGGGNIFSSCSLKIKSGRSGF